MPRQDYISKRTGEKVPGVTSIIGDSLGWKGYGLMIWAHNLGKEGKSLKEERNALAEAGSMTHLLASYDILGKPPPDITAAPVELQQKALASFEAYKAWKATTKLELVASEVPLVSEERQYGGCLDCIATWDGSIGLLDFKSAKDLYPDTLVQIAAYWRLWEENNPDMPLNHWHVLRWAPDGSFHHHSLGRDRMEAAWRVFVACLDIYNLKKIVKGASNGRSRARNVTAA